jgi:hypothetical protein
VIYPSRPEEPGSWVPQGLRALIDRAWPALGIEFDAPGDPFDVGRYSHVLWGVLRAADLAQDDDAVYGAFSALDTGRIPADLTWVRDRFDIVTMEHAK